MATADRARAFSHVYAKQVLANERTLTQWLNNAFLLSAGAVALLTRTRLDAQLVGSAMLLVSLVATGYALWQWRRRAAALRRGAARFDWEARAGPTLFAAAFAVAFVLVVLMAWTLRVNPACGRRLSGAPRNATRAVDVWAGVFQQRALELLAALRVGRARDLCPDTPEQGPSVIDR